MLAQGDTQSLIDDQVVCPRKRPPAPNIRVSGVALPQKGKVVYRCAQTGVDLMLDDPEKTSKAPQSGDNVDKREVFSAVVPSGFDPQDVYLPSLFLDTIEGVLKDHCPIFSIAPEHPEPMITFVFIFLFCIALIISSLTICFWVNSRESIITNKIFFFFVFFLSSSP